MKKFGNVALLAVAITAFACVCMWGCGVDDGWGEREFRAYDVAKVVVFLASEQAAYLTGVVLPIDGGASL